MTMSAQTLKGGWTDTDQGSVASTALGANAVVGNTFQNVGKVSGTGTPNGDLTAPIGWKYTDDASGREYLNTDGATAWEAITTQQTIADTPSAAGQEIPAGVDGKSYMSAYEATTTLGDVVQLNFINTAGQEVTAAAPVTTSFPTMTAVAIATRGTAGIGWYQIGGIVEAGVEGTTDVAAGDFLEVLNTESAFKKDGASRTTNSGAMAIDAQAANSVVVVTVMLINQQHVVAAS